MNEHVHITITAVPISRAVDEDAPILTIKVPRVVTGPELREIMDIALRRLEEDGSGTS